MPNSDQEIFVLSPRALVHVKWLNLDDVGITRIDGVRITGIESATITRLVDVT
jgi:hypothetical protein